MFILKILIAYDGPEMRRAVGLAVERWGYEASISEDCLSAHTAASLTIPDLIIFQFNDPVSTFLSVPSALKEDPETASVPVFVISGDSDPEIEQMCVGAGASDYMSGRWTFEELRHRIRMALALRSQ